MRQHDRTLLKHDTITVKELVKDYRSGDIVIPEFQRDYVWKKSKAPLLLDFFVQKFPNIVVTDLEEYRSCPVPQEGVPACSRLRHELAHRWPAAGHYTFPYYEWR